MRHARPTLRGYSFKISTIGFLALAGCSSMTGYPKNYQQNSAVIAADSLYLSADVRNAEDSQNDSDRGGLTQQQYRDTVVYRRIEVIDINYYDFESQLSATYDGIGLGSDLAELVLNGLGATTGAAATKAALAAASAGVIGANASVNKDLFYQKTVPVLVAQMRASRQSALATIETGLTNPVTKYSLDQALNDVNAYYIAGTLPGALNQITTQAGATTDAANNELAAIRSATFVPPPPGGTAQQILYWLYPNGDETKPVNAANLQTLSSWMAKDSVDPILQNIPYQDLLTGSGLTNAESDRQRAIKALNIPEVAP